MTQQDKSARVKVTIDRFEDGYAVLLVRGEECVQIDFPERLLPEGCREGDILDIEISRDVESTEEARKRVSDLIEKLKKKQYD
jgi:hypothetical protein